MVKGKGATLEYIARELSDIPIPSFSRVPADLRWGIFGLKPKALAKKIGYPLIVRSDAQCEDGLGASFAGLFRSEVVEESWRLEQTLEVVRSGYDLDRVRTYTHARGLSWPTDGKKDGKVKIDAMFQRFSPSEIRCIVTRHPHQADLLFVDLEIITRDPFPKRAGFRVLPTTDIEQMLGANVKLNARIGDIGIWASILRDQTGQDLQRALDDYRRVEALPGFDRDVSYQMECGLLPYAFFQWRPFRKRETAQFSLDAVAPSEMDGEVHEVPIVFGITPPTGVEVVHIGVEHLVFPEISIQTRGRTGTHYEQYLKDMYPLVKDLHEAGVKLGVSFYVIGKYGGPLDAVASIPPELAIFNYGYMGRKDNKTEYSMLNYGWQAHDSFRYLERGTLVALAPDAPYTENPHSRLRYWSDGREGRLQFVK